MFKLIRNSIKHFGLITKHKWYVFRLCVKCGLILQGITHDLSKYSWAEFYESIKYYCGDRSALSYCKQINGYSLAWLHHKGRNKHHHQYWYDYDTPNKTPMMPYKYVVEMICDDLAAGMVYNGKKWTNHTQLDYWNSKKDIYFMNDRLKKMLTVVYTKVSEEGINKVITKHNLEKLYNEYCK